jgi:glycosyltransferase 2 family protein
MSRSYLKTVAQYIVIISITVGLLWFSLRGIVVGEGQNKGQLLWDTWKSANKGFLLLMAVTTMASHIIRAERWKMLLVPTGNKIRFSSSFLSLMIGYLVNLAVPRGGEVSRCYNLYKLEATPVETSFGTVVTERIVDVLCLLVLIVVCFVVEWTKLETFINSLHLGAESGFRVPTWLILLVIAGVAGLIALFFLRENKKLKEILIGFKEGLLSVFRLKKKWLFVFYSLAIWGLYFLMSFWVIKAFSETSHLGFNAVLTMFAIGSIAMTVPLPGGTGSYHTLVPLGLVMLYNLPRTDAVAFTFIFHAWQTLIMIVSGIISLIISYWLIRWRKAKTK